MARFNSPLDQIRIAAPCSANWDEMTGDERVRFCRECNLNVYNLSSMSRSEAETLISSTEGRLCVRYYRRRDGTILTSNCPVGLRAIKRRVSRVASSMLSAVLGFLAGLGLYTGMVREEKPQIYNRTMGTLVAPLKEPVTPIRPNYEEGQVVGLYTFMGKARIQEPSAQTKGRGARRPLR